MTTYGQLWEDDLRSEAMAAGIRRLVAAAAIVDLDRRVLLLQRRSDDFMGLIFEMPGGRVEAGESILEGLSREVQEETELRLDRITHYVGHFDYASASGARTRQFTFAAEVDGTDSVCVHEHMAFEWVRLDDIDTVAVTAETRSMLQRVRRVLA